MFFSFAATVAAGAVDKEESSTSIIVDFNQSTYIVNENDGPAQPVLVLSNSSSTDIIVQVYAKDGSATGKYCDITWHHHIRFYR